MKSSCDREGINRACCDRSKCSLRTTNVTYSGLQGRAKDTLHAIVARPLPADVGLGSRPAQCCDPHPGKQGWTVEMGDDEHGTWGCMHG